MSTKLSGIASGVATAAVIGGFVWVQEIGTRVALIEDDLGETVDVIAILHPPSRAALHHEPEVFYTGNKYEKHDQRKDKLDKLKERAPDPAPKGDDDDSATPAQEA